MAIPKDLEASTVEALVNSLKKFPKDTLVVLSSDAEGNDFNPLEGVDPEAHWVPAEGDLFFSEIDDTPPDDALPAIVLFPMHR